MHRLVLNLQNQSFLLYWAIVTEWQKAIRRVIQLPYCTRRWLLGPLSGQGNIIEQLHCKTVRFIVRGINHTNPIVKLIYNISLISARSPLGANMSCLSCKCGTDFDSCVHTLLNCMYNIMNWMQADKG